MQVDFTRVLEPLLSLWPMFTVLFLMVLVLKLLNSPKIKGWFGERAVRNGLSKLDATKYHAYHDLYFPRPDGKGTTQIDHIVISEFGIFVIETKNYRGWIFGSPKQAQWTCQIYKTKNRFQNPLFQNDLHVRALSEFLGFSMNRFIPVVFFVGDAKFKTEMPDNVLNRGLLDFIGKFKVPSLTPPEFAAGKELLANLDRMTNRKSSAKAHVSSIKERERQAEK